MAAPAADSEAGPAFVRAALADLSDAAGHLARGADAALASAAEEAAILLESGGRLDGGLDGGTALQTASVALCQSVFLLGLPGFNSAGAGGGRAGAEWAGRLLVWKKVRSS
jgi:hypothetical protein